MALKKIKTSDEILTERFELLSERTELSRNTLVNDLKAQRAQLVAKIKKMTDFNPKSSDSLIPNVDENWDADEWAQQLQELDMKLDWLDRQINVAEKRNKELFTTEA